MLVPIPEIWLLTSQRLCTLYRGKLECSMEGCLTAPEAGLQELVRGALLHAFLQLLPLNLHKQLNVTDGIEESVNSLEAVGRYTFTSK